MLARRESSGCQPEVSVASTDSVVFPPAPREQVGAGSGPGTGPGVGSGGASLDGEPPPFVAEHGAFRGDAADTPLSGTGAAALVIVAVTGVGTGVVAPL